MKSYDIMNIILLHENFLPFDWLRAVVFQLNLKYLHVKTISKYHSWYLCQISLQIMLLPILKLKAFKQFFGINTVNCDVPRVLKVRGCG